MNAAQLRELAVRMLAVAMNAKDQQLLDWLCKHAGEYLDKADLLEVAQRPINNAEKKE
jgi:DNA-binding winged helix-turn-helix (wHTH) protein